MRVQQAPVHCIACKHEWLAEMIIAAPVEVWGASVKVFRCPQCGVGAKKIAFGRGDVPDPRPIQEPMTDGDRRLAWLRLYDNGLSSECIADVMCGMPPSGCHPTDGHDFGRCERLLMLYPEWRTRFREEMPRVSPAWAALVASWDDVTGAWKHDVELFRRKGRRATGWRCYDLMRAILTAAERGDG